MRLGLSTAAFYGRWETEEAASKLASLRVDSAEVFLQTPSEYKPSFAAQVRANLGDIPCVSVHPLGSQFENQMFARSQRQKQDAFDMFRRVLDAAQVLGARYYIYHGRNTPQLAALPFNLAANVDMLGRMNEEALLRGIAIAWENVYWCQLTTCERVERVKQALPDVRFTLDVKPAMRAGEDPLRMARAMGANVAHVHVCDWDARGKLCLPGEGVFDFEGLINVLRQVGYEGDVIMEPYEALIGSGEALEASIRYLRMMLEQGKTGDI